MSSLAVRLVVVRLGVALALSASLSGCGPELEKISELRGLRVLAVQKDTPYAAPEQDVEFRMLWEDGSTDGPREAERFWIGGCVNPPGDLYSGCFAQWLETIVQGGAGAAGQPGELFGQGDRFVTRSAPLRPAVQDPNAPPYGVAFVFFGVCAGRLDWAGWATRLQAGQIRDLGDAFPYCVDAVSGEPLGSDDYVVGYSSVYSYGSEQHRNANPVFGVESEQGPLFEVAGAEVLVDCVGEACVCPADGDAGCRTPFPIPELTGCVPGLACIEACADDGEPSCPEIGIRPILEPARNVEQDTVARDAFGRDVEESLWISYFVDRGSVKSELRLLNDGAIGWNDDYGTKLYAPREPGPLRIWAVVRDNRGGVNWVRLPAYVR